MRSNLPSGHHHGTVSSSRDIAGFALTETIYPPDLTLPEHSHEHACLCLVLRGSYAEIYGKTVLACQPLTVLFRPPAEAHTDHIHGAGGHCFLIEPDPSWLVRIGEHSVKLDRPMSLQGGLVAWLAIRLYREFRHPDEVSPLAVEGLTLAIAAEMPRRRVGDAAREPPRWLEQAKEALRAGFAAPPTLSGIAASVGVHPVYLASAFHKHYRCTVGEYVRRLRVEFACRELSTSDAPLVDIALRAGFSSQAHFSRTFKRLTDMTPVEYRRAFRVA